MSSSVSANSAKYKMIIDGQSLNFSPTEASSWPRLLLANYPISNRNISIVGYAWLQLVDMVTSRRDPFATKAPITIVTMNGGTTDYIFDRTGLQCYTDMKNYANTAHSASFNYVIATTTTPCSAFGAHTTVAPGSNNVNTNTFTAATGVLNVASTTDALGSGTILVQTGGTEATITYTGTTSTTFTGCTTTSGGGVMTTGGYAWERSYSNWLDGNARIVANADVAFDYVVDVAGDSRLSDYNNTTYYAGDKTHFTLAGSQVFADLVQPTLDTIIAANGGL